MIPRLLVPRDVRPPAATPAAPPRRLTTLLDDRELVPANWPHNPLDTHTTIPAHMPLDVLASRVRRAARHAARRRSTRPVCIPITRRSR